MLGKIADRRENHFRSFPRRSPLEAFSTAKLHRRPSRLEQSGRLRVFVGIFKLVVDEDRSVAVADADRTQLPPCHDRLLLLDLLLSLLRLLMLLLLLLLARVQSSF